MRIVAWVTAGIGVLTALGLGASVQRGGLLLVSPPPLLVETSAARCPDHHLEDNGVCLPLGRTRLTAPAIDVDDWVAPDSRLSSFQVSWRDAPVSPSRRADLAGETPVRLVRTRVGAPVFCAAALSGARVARVEKTLDGAYFLTLARESANTGLQQWILTGLTSVAPDVREGSTCLTETVLGVSGDALVFYQPSPNAVSGASAPSASAMLPSASATLPVPPATATAAPGATP